MPINFDLEKIRKEYDCLNYFETGLHEVANRISCERPFVKETKDKCI
tara:strand:- start:380 stop:520 length:141 start_codon:yes stop_codon:yes gene_type:complete